MKTTINIILFVLTLAYMARNSFIQKNGDEVLDNMLGKWVATKVEGKQKFSDGTHGMEASLPPEGDFIQFSQEETGNTGEFFTVQYGMEQSGTWTYQTDNQLLSIVYTSFEPHFTLLRKVETATKEKLVLTIDDDLTKEWVELNHIMEESPVKIVGGYFYEEYKRAE